MPTGVYVGAKVGFCHEMNCFFCGAETLRICKIGISFVNMKKREAPVRKIFGYVGLIISKQEKHKKRSDVK
jgi:hypothetical protein